MTTSENVLSLAKELAAAIKDSDVFASYERAREASDKDEELQRLIGEFNLKRLVITNEMEKEEPDENVVNSVNEEMKVIYDKIMANDNMKMYNIRKSYVDQLLNSVNETIMAAITGQEKTDCTHDCSTCGGCH